MAVKLGSDADKSRLRSWLGGLLIVVGLAAVSVPLYQELIQSPIEAGNQSAEAKQTAERYSRDPHPSHLTNAKLAVGQVFGLFYAPRLGKNFRRLIGQGTSVEQVLNPVGIGHYLGTALPGQVGNFALASHRTTHGGAFNYIDTFIPGDDIVVETRWGWYDYKVLTTKVVEPSERWVIQADPLHLGTGRYITLTTCTPRYTAAQRLIVWGKLAKSYPRSGGEPSELADILKVSTN
ncbi:MAG: class E sortase [Phenylobacterium zucineum]|nr:MAG: class E sortase [Phenylobacterium zucineum]